MYIIINYSISIEKMLTVIIVIVGDTAIYPKLSTFHYNNHLISPVVKVLIFQGLILLWYFESLSENHAPLTY